MAKFETLKFYRCDHCGNIVQMIETKGVPVFCCGEPMNEITANTVEASHEKHIPVVTKEGEILKVAVGSVEHPMLEEHYIEWIYLETECGTSRKILKPGDTPAVEFALNGEKPVAVYAYCNIHGLWKSEL